MFNKNKHNRLEDINNMVDSNIKNNIDILINKYSNELKDYKYIETLDNFILLSLKGSIKYINKYTGILHSGGLLIKIYNKNNNNWYAIIKQISGKKYNISFKSNHIFYCETKSKLLRDWMEYFITDLEEGKYSIY